MKRQELISRISQLLSGSLDLDKFEEWIVAHLDQSENHPDSEVRSLLNLSDILLMKLRDGFIDVPEFFDELDASLRQLETLGRNEDFSLVKSVSNDANLEDNIESSSVAFSLDPERLEIVV